jgi:membrane-bound ClpP family serine protease
LDNLQRRINVIVLGLVLMLIGFIAKVPILWSVGILVAVIGVVLMLLGMAGREVGGRRHYY